MKQESMIAMKNILFNIKSILRAFHIKPLNKTKGLSNTETQKFSGIINKGVHNKEHVIVKDINNEMPLMLFI